MKTCKIKGAFYIVTAPYNQNIVIVHDGESFGVLKIYANANNYFNGSYYPETKYFDGAKLSRVSLTELKKDLVYALNKSDKYFTKNEYIKLMSLFNISEKKYPQLSESATCSRVKGYKKPSTNKRVKTYARKRK
jgi:hypothetical protein